MDELTKRQNLQALMSKAYTLSRYLHPGANHEQGFRELTAFLQEIGETPTPEGTVHGAAVANLIAWAVRTRALIKVLSQPTLHFTCEETADAGLSE